MNTLKEMVEKAITTTQHQHGTSEVIISGVTTGYTELDDITNGLQPANMIVLANRPNMGKTPLALCMARNAAIKGNTSVIYFSMETTAESMVERLICSEARVSWYHLRSGRLSDEELQRVLEWTEKLREASIYIDDTPALSISALQEKSWQATSEHPIGLIIIDSLELMATSEQHANRAQEINTIIQSIKALACELNVPIVVCSQLLPSVEKNEEQRPAMADLGFMNLELFSDVVMYLYRPEMYGVLDEDGHCQGGVAEIILEKQRNGPTGSVFLDFVEEYQRFEDPEMYREF
jgi:replicative DNA helicase